MVRAAGEHPGLKLGEDLAGHLGILQRPCQVRIDLHELPEVALRAFNSDLRSMLIHGFPYEPTRPLLILKKMVGSFLISASFCQTGPSPSANPRLVRADQASELA